MAEIKEGILGGIHGKLGPTVGFQWRGRYFLRTRPRKSNKPATEMQKIQRDKMGLISTFSSKIKDFVNGHYPPALLNGKMATGKEQLISMLMKDGIVVIEGVACIDLASVLLSIGSLSPAVIKKVSKLKTGRIKVLWDNSITNVLAKATDRLTMVAYNEMLNEFVEIASISKREDKYVHFDLPEKWRDGNIHFWSVWKSADGKRHSTSAYHGITTMGEEESAVEEEVVSEESTKAVDNTKQKDNQLKGSDAVQQEAREITLPEESTKAVGNTKQKDSQLKGSDAAQQEAKEITLPEESTKAVDNTKQKDSQLKGSDAAQQDAKEIALPEESIKAVGSTKQKTDRLKGSDAVQQEAKEITLQKKQEQLKGVPQTLDRGDEPRSVLEALMYRKETEERRGDKTNDIP
ncbi:MAG: DUF6266 family protein [Flavobacteriaceae bacterium]|jgi:hypothetical protein|nr:DUF6266 family protein [Flavobacteriaceae bacterium]